MSPGDPNYRREPPDAVDDDIVGWGWWWWIILWIILIIIFFGGGWWWGGWYGNRYRGNGQPTPTNNSGPGNLTQGPRIWQDMIGRVVTTPGKVDHTFNNLPQVFTLASAGNGSEPLLVIVTSKPASPAAAVKNGENVVVTGTVHRFIRAEVAQQTGLNLPENEFSQWAGRMYILATKVAPETAKHPQ